MLTQSLDVSYTRAPDWVHMIPNYEHDPHSTFWSLARLGFTEEREKNLVEPLPSPQHQAVLPPDEQVLCYDYVYYVCAQQVSQTDNSLPHVNSHAAVVVMGIRV